MSPFEKELRLIVKDELIKLLSKDSIALNEAVSAYAFKDIVSDNLLKLAAKAEKEKGYFTSSDLICDECQKLTKAMTILELMENKGLANKNSKMQYRISGNHTHVFDFLEDEFSEAKEVMDLIIKRDFKTVSVNTLNKGTRKVKSAKHARRILESLEREKFLKIMPDGGTVNGKRCQESWEVLQ